MGEPTKLLEFSILTIEKLKMLRSGILLTWLNIWVIESPSTWSIFISTAFLSWFWMINDFLSSFSKISFCFISSAFFDAWRNIACLSASKISFSDFPLNESIWSRASFQISFSASNSINLCFISSNLESTSLIGIIWYDSAFWV